MKNAKISTNYGYIVRKEALSTRKITRETLDEIFEANALDENSTVITYGPSFGGEAAAVFHKRLENKGLAYVDDFFMIEIDLPEWISLSVSDRT